MKGGSSQTIHTCKPYWLSWLFIFEIHFGCHDNLILGKSPIKWGRRPDMTMTVDGDATNKNGLSCSECNTYTCIKIYASLY